MCTVLTLFVCAYLLGALSLTYWIGRCRSHLAVTDYGPGSIGPVKLLRLAGPESMVAALLAELTKGWLIGWLTVFFQAGEIAQWLTALFLLAGYGWSPVLGGRGGNICLPFTGFLFQVAPPLGQVALSVALSVLLLTRSPNLAALIALVSLPCVAWLQHFSVFALAVTTAAAAVVAFQFWLVRCHRPRESEIY
ncbi:hypothetical protein GTO89_12425 [Heliobacterium gestii]|uniref:Glycerol-3-phosphate acyltransferase n=1 Tax=Heliomicrobium gestii TaxID=2699 RepID=A0A845LB06_HELGE|nr:glycerol-3-phosphate acyltransferase [Heliomicrobium gestii]MBM7867289.1 glycerol-3-phosphate acyltransferase PlsY [Heliomicrobium gestii]MZP43842.1 hypothetical protein [Heliomicrobium gestii]